MSQYELSPGRYSGIYWTVQLDSKRLLILPGHIPWGKILLIEPFLVGLAVAILWPAWLMTGHGKRWLFVGMCFPVGLGVLGPLILPIHQILSERSKGPILLYDRERERVLFPRERLSLPKAQIAEFRVLHEYLESQERRAKTFSLRQESRSGGNIGSAELQVIYKTPNEKVLSLLRAGDVRFFKDVVDAVKETGLASVTLVEQQPNLIDWKVSEW